MMWMNIDTSEAIRFVVDKLIVENILIMITKVVSNVSLTYFIEFYLQNDAVVTDAVMTALYSSTLLNRYMHLGG